MPGKARNRSTSLVSLWTGTALSTGTGSVHSGIPSTRTSAGHCDAAWVRTRLMTTKAIRSRRANANPKPGRRGAVGHMWDGESRVSAQRPTVARQGACASSWPCPTTSITALPARPAGQCCGITYIWTDEFHLDHSQTAVRFASVARSRHVHGVRVRVVGGNSFQITGHGSFHGAPNAVEAV